MTSSYFVLWTPTLNEIYKQFTSRITIMNSIALSNTIANEFTLEENFLRDLADIEVVLVGGGEIAVVGS
jgi:hypothetical protein